MAKLKMKIVKKPWGKEEWIVVTKKYVMKRLFVTKGHKFSLQYHKKKDEAWLFTKGKARIILGNKKIFVKPGDIFHIKPRTIHRVEALTNVEFMEVSTPELTDVVRIEDDYNRA